MLLIKGAKGYAFLRRAAHDRTTALGETKGAVGSSPRPDDGASELLGFAIHFQDCETPRAGVFTWDLEQTIPHMPATGSIASAWICSVHDCVALMSKRTTHILALWSKPA